MENVAATELDNIVTTYDNETGEELSEKEFPGDTVIFGRDGTEDLYAIFKPVEDQYGYTFVLLDGKMYAQFDGTDREYVYYIIDKEDVHRSMNKYPFVKSALKVRSYF